MVKVCVAGREADFPLLLLGGALIRTAEEKDLVKVATFNINDINKRLDNLVAWLTKAEPDVVSLQELKAEQGAFPVRALRHGNRRTRGVGR